MAKYKPIYKKGDLVRVAKDLGRCMSHFTADCDAIVIEATECQGTGSYGLYLKEHGESWWYEEWQLTLIAKDQRDLLNEWKRSDKANRLQRKDLDWIFANGKEVLAKGYGESIGSLAACFGLKNLWGSSGEGMTYYLNGRFTMEQAAPFLKSSDKAGWLEHCKTLKKWT